MPGDYNFISVIRHNSGSIAPSSFADFILIETVLPHHGLAKKDP